MMDHQFVNRLSFVLAALLTTSACSTVGPRVRKQELPPDQLKFTEISSGELTDFLVRAKSGDFFTLGDGGVAEVEEEESQSNESDRQTKHEESSGKDDDDAENERDPVLIEYSLISPSGAHLITNFVGGFSHEPVSVRLHEEGVYRLRVSQDAESKARSKLSAKWSKKPLRGKTETVPISRKNLGHHTVLISKWSNKAAEADDTSEAEGQITEERPTGFLVQILKNGRLEWEQWIQGMESLEFFGDKAESPEERALADWPDKTGDGAPDVMLLGYSGGAHCCYQLVVFELGKEIRQLEPLSLEHGEILVEKKNPAGGLYFMIGDYSFAYWYAPFSDRPNVTVTVKFVNGKLEADFDQMRRPPPLDQELRADADLVRKKMSNSPFIPDRWHLLQGEPNFFGDLPKFSDRLLKLFYTGNESAAWKYLDWLWPESKPGKELFITELKQALNGSWYGEEFRKRHPEYKSSKIR